MRTKIFGECGKHPGNNMVNCIECSMEKPILFDANPTTGLNVFGKSMENKEIIEGNKLIAKFMGGKYRKGNKKKFDEERYFDLKDKGYYYLVSELKYHTLWDWLMPVVEKIESLGYDFEFNKQGKFTNVRFKGIIDYNCKRYDNIVAIYNTVVEFIKWYNENKQV